MSISPKVFGNLKNPNNNKEGFSSNSLVQGEAMINAVKNTSKKKVSAITPNMFTKFSPLVISNPSEEKLDASNQNDDKLNLANPGNINKKYSTFRLQRVDNLDIDKKVKKEDLTIVNEYSAGGIVFNDNNCAAIISRINRKGKEEWCFPKGHLEDSENPEQAAIREVREETGLKTKIVNLLGIVDYNFLVGEYEIHKKVHHYALEKVEGSFSKRVDPDGEVHRILWVPFNKLQSVLTYENERKLAKLFLSII